MQRLCFTALFTFLLTPNLTAQSPPPAPTSPASQSAAPASGPTMEQTMAFISGAIAEHGDFSYGDRPKIAVSQQLVFEPPCTVRFAYNTIMFSKKTWAFSLRMDLADPRTISVHPFGKESPTPWVVEVNADHQLPPTLNGEQLRWDETNPEFYVGQFMDKDLAQRVAKAYIHAIVLCHKPEAPSPF